MKRLWIVIAILLSIVGVSTAGIVHLTKVTEEMQASLAQIIDATEAEDSVRASALTDAFILEWNKNETVMVRYLHHDTLDSLTGYIARLPALARYERYSDLTAEIERVQKLLEHLRQAEMPNWQNIF